MQQTPLQHTAIARQASLHDRDAPNGQKKGCLAGAGALVRAERGLYRDHGALKRREDGAIVATVEAVRDALTGSGYVISGEGQAQNCHYLKLASGQRVNVFHTGTVQVQGKNPDPVRAVLEHLDEGGATNAATRKVFVVYGHDGAARTALENMLRRWALEPIVLDDLTSEGDTLIEKLQRYSRDVAYAVVLATPDDEGHRRGHPDERKARARQNVVLELGMLLERLGRKNVAILMPSGGDVLMERPSDIEGLVYIPFRDSIEDVRILLAKELNAAGLQIETSKI